MVPTCPECLLLARPPLREGPSFAFHKRKLRSSSRKGFAQTAQQGGKGARMGTSSSSSKVCMASAPWAGIWSTSLNPPEPGKRCQTDGWGLEQVAWVRRNPGDRLLVSRVAPTVLGSRPRAARWVRSAAWSPRPPWPRLTTARLLQLSALFLTRRPRLVPVCGFLQRRNANTSTGLLSCCPPSG